MPQSDIINDHSEALGSLRADVEVLKGQNGELFRRVNEISTSVAMLVEGVSTLKKAIFALFGVSVIAFIAAVFSYLFRMVLNG